MRRIRLLALGGLIVLAPLGYAAPPANACEPYNGGSCTPGACKIKGVDPTLGSTPYLECTY